MYMYVCGERVYVCVCVCVCLLNIHVHTPIHTHIYTHTYIHTYTQAHQYGGSGAMHKDALNSRSKKSSAVRGRNAFTAIKRYCV